MMEQMISPDRLPEVVHSCTSCRRRKVLCDKVAPSCGPCSRKGIECTYTQGITRYSVSRAKACLQCQRRRTRCDRQEPCTGCTRSGVECEYISGRPKAQTTALSRDVEDAEESNHLDQSQNIEVEHSSVLTSSSLLGAGTPNRHTRKLHPSLPQIWNLYHIYAENVDPLIKIIHLPSFHRQLLRSVENLATLDLQVETILFSMYFAAVVTLEEQ